MELLWLIKPDMTDGDIQYPDVGGYVRDSNYNPSPTYTVGGLYGWDINQVFYMPGPGYISDENLQWVLFDEIEDSIIISNISSIFGYEHIIKFRKAKIKAFFNLENLPKDWDDHFSIQYFLANRSYTSDERLSKIEQLGGILRCMVIHTKIIKRKGKSCS